MDVRPSTQQTNTHNDTTMMIGKNTGRCCFDLISEAKESSASDRHILFPSRSPPPINKRRSSKNEKTKRSSIAILIDELATVRVSPTKHTSDIPKVRSPLERSLRETMHRRSKHIFVSSHSPTKSKLSSPSKVKTIRKHHRGHNLALNVKDFDVLFQAVKG